MTPICLPNSFNSDPDARHGYAGTVTGWGKTGQMGDVSKVLRQGKLTIFSEKYCNLSRTLNRDGETLLNPSFLPKLFQSDVFCAGKICSIPQYQLIFTEILT